jgi:peptide alpha-N-acetyltransferase
MKGLVLVHMGRQEEGIYLVKKGVRLDLTSHIVGTSSASFRRARKL